VIQIQRSDAALSLLLLHHLDYKMFLKKQRHIVTHVHVLGVTPSYAVPRRDACCISKACWMRAKSPSGARLSATASVDGPPSTCTDDARDARMCLTARPLSYGTIQAWEKTVELNSNRRVKRSHVKFLPSPQTPFGAFGILTFDTPARFSKSSTPGHRANGGVHS
jgi:hypothetical protein